MARPRRPRLTHLDTHVVCWLYAGRIDLLSVAARNAVERDTLAVSPIVALEIQHLCEIGRMRERPGRVLAALRREMGLALSDLPLAAVVARARLLTRDDLLRRHFPAALW